MTKEEILKDTNENIDYLFSHMEKAKAFDIMEDAFRYVDDSVKVESYFRTRLNCLLEEDESKALVVMGYIRHAFEIAD